MPEEKKKPVFIDVSSHAEDCRVRTIGETAVANPGKKIGFITDAEPGKAERYIAKLQEWFPGLDVEKVPSFLPNTVGVKCVYPLSKSN